MTHSRHRFALRLTTKQCLQYYSGQVRNIVVMTERGTRLAFPASELRKFVTRNGISGRFEIVYSDQHKLVSLTRLAP